MTPLRLALGIVALFNILVAQADAGLIGSTVDVAAYFPNSSTVFEDPGSRVVTGSVEYPTGSFPLYNPNFSVDVQDNAIVIGLTGTTFQSTSFNGFIVTILSPTGQTFTGTPTASGVAPTNISIAGNQLLIDFSGVTASGGSTTTITFATSDPVAAVPEPATVTLFGFAAAGGACYGWRRRRAAV